MSNPFGAIRKFPADPSVPAEHKLETPYTEKYNLTIEHQLSNGLDFRLGYVGHLRRVDASSEFHQFHPVTAQWMAPDRTVDWLKITKCPFIDAEATKQGIAITTEPGEVTFRIFSPGTKAEDATADKWNLAGLTVKIDTDGSGFKTESGENYIDITYSSVSRMRMQFLQTSNKALYGRP